MHLTESEEAALAGSEGEVMQMAYRILVATGEATDAERLVPIQWAHLSGVNYNTIGDAGEEFLKSISSSGARVRVKTTLNPMGFDADSVQRYGLDDEFVSKQASIADSYKKIGVTPSFSCIPYEIYEMPDAGAQVAFAESNAAIYANSLAGLKTNKESAFSALASALTGKSPYSNLRKDDDDGVGKKEDGNAADVTVRMEIPDPDELEYGMLGYFAGKIGDASVDISNVRASAMDRRQCKAICGGMGTSGTCAKFRFADMCENEGKKGKSKDRIDFDLDALRRVRDELDTAENGDIITLGSPQLGLWEISDLAGRLGGRSFKKRCMVFCPRTVKEQAQNYGHIRRLERAGCEILTDCCTCLSPLVESDDVDSVTTNSVKGAFYLNNASGVGVELKPLAKILEDETE